MKKNNIKLCSSIFKICGFILISLALVLTFYNLGEDFLAGRSSNNVLKELEDNKLVAEDFIPGTPDYMATPKMEMPTVKLDNTKYIGVITIDKIGIKLPVQGEWNFKKLRKSPAKYSGSAYLSNFIIAAHYRSQFGRIWELKNGDKVKFEDMEGHIFEYEVIGKETISEKDGLKLEEGEWDLTLFTCSLNTQYRTVVRLRKIATY